MQRSSLPCRISLTTMGVTCACTDQLRSLGHTHHFSGIVKNFEAAARELFNEQHLTVVSAKVLPYPACSLPVLLNLDRATLMMLIMDSFVRSFIPRSNSRCLRAKCR